MSRIEQKHESVETVEKIEGWTIRQCSVYISVCVSMHSDVCVCACVCVRACVRACVRVRACVCVRVYVFLLVSSNIYSNIPFILLGVGGQYIVKSICMVKRFHPQSEGKDKTRQSNKFTLFTVLKYTLYNKLIPIYFGRLFVSWMRASYYSDRKSAHLSYTTWCYSAGNWTPRKDLPLTEYINTWQNMANSWAKTREIHLWMWWTIMKYLCRAWNRLLFITILLRCITTMWLDAKRDVTWIHRMTFKTTSFNVNSFYRVWPLTSLYSALDHYDIDLFSLN